MLDARPRRLILAYLIVGLAGVALAGALADSKPLLALGGGLGYLLAMVHAVSFMIRARKRRSPAALEPVGRRILAVTLGAFGAIAIANLVTVSVILQGEAKVQPGALAAVSVWMVLILVLAWRAWILPSARRSAILQIVSMLLALPGVFGPAVSAIEKLGPRKVPLSPMQEASLMTAVMIGFVVVSCAGPVLDKLFSTTPDKDPSSPVPEAIIRA